VIQQCGGPDLLAKPYQYVVRTTRFVYLRIEKSRWPGMVHNPVVRWVKARVTRMPLRELRRVLEAFERDGVDFVVVGGWGIDGLLGLETRAHYDLDVVISHDEKNRSCATASLASIGYYLRNEVVDDGLPMPWRMQFVDDRGHLVDLLPLNRSLPPFGGVPGRPIVKGYVGGRSFPCISVQVQRTLHTNYPLRSSDLIDLANLPASSGPGGGGPEQ